MIPKSSTQYRKAHEINSHQKLIISLQNYLYLFNCQRFKEKKKHNLSLTYIKSFPKSMNRLLIKSKVFFILLGFNILYKKNKVNENTN